MTSSIPYSRTSSDEIITLFERDDPPTSMGAHRFDIRLGRSSPSYLVHLSRLLHLHLDRISTSQWPIYEWDWRIVDGEIVGFNLYELPLASDCYSHGRRESLWWIKSPHSFTLWLEGEVAIYRGIQPHFLDDIVLTIEHLDEDSDLHLVGDELYLMLHHLVDIYAIRAHYLPTDTPGTKRFTGDLVVEGKYWHPKVTDMMIPGRYGQHGRWCPIRIRKSYKSEYPHSQYNLIRMRPWPNPILPQPKRLHKRRRTYSPPARSLARQKARPLDGPLGHQTGEGLHEPPRGRLRT